MKQLNILGNLICPINETDPARVAEITAAILAGKEIDPIRILDLGNEWVALTGSHRIAAYAAIQEDNEDEMSEIEISYKLLEENDLPKPMKRALKQEGIGSRLFELAQKKWD